MLGRNSAHPALMFDANESWNRTQAVRFVSELERTVDLAWIEEPVRRWDAAGLASVRQHVRAAVATGENLTGLEQYRPLLDADAVDIVQVGNVWGITHFLRVAAVAHSHDLPVSPVAYHANPVAHAAAAVPNHLSFEVQHLDVADRAARSIRRSWTAGSSSATSRASASGSTRSRSTRYGRPTRWPATTGPHVRPRRAGLRLVPDTRLGDAPRRSPADGRQA